MSGDVGCTSEPGFGSYFWATIHLERSGPEIPKEIYKYPDTKFIIIYQCEVKLNIIEKYLLHYGVKKIEKYSSFINVPNPEQYILIISTEMIPQKDLSKFKDVIVIQNYDQKSLVYPYKTIRRPLNYDNIIKIISNDPIDKKKEKEQFIKDYRILLCEDNVVVHRLEKKLLIEYGAIVESAFDGKDSIEKFKNFPKFDLILLDINLPFLNGCEICKYIRKYNDKDKSNTRIIILSGSVNSQLRKELILSGVEQVISKPIDIESLIQKIIKQNE